MSDTGKRIVFLRKKLGFSQENFAKAIGITAKTLSIYEGNNPDQMKLSTLKDIANICSASVTWLLNGDASEDQADLGVFEIPIFNNYCCPVGEIMKLDKKLFKDDKLLNLKILKIFDDSMIPALPQGSFVVVNDINHFEGDGIYAIKTGNTILIKAIQIDLNGDIYVISLNQIFKTLIIKKDEAPNIEVIGKVIKQII